jgi:hypothetical protein
MEYHSFLKLCDIIHANIKVDNIMSKIKTGKGPITVEIMLHCLLRWLGGGSYLDIRLCAGISVASFYRPQLEKQVTLRHIFLVIINHTASIYRQPVIINVALYTKMFQKISKFLLLSRQLRYIILNILLCQFIFFI